MGIRLKLVTAACAALSILLAASLAPADVLRLKNGRIIDGQTMKKVQGGVKILYKHGEVFVPQARILDVLIMSPDGTFEPRNEKERAKLEKGLMPFGNKWVTKSKYEQLVKKRLAAAKAKIEEAKKHQAWRDRYKKQTKNFAFEYTIPLETAQEYMDLFEVYYKIFTKHWGIRRGKMAKLKVCFYHDEEYFAQVSGAGSGTLGYFRFVPPIELNVYNLRNDKEMTIDVIFHEVNHYLVHLIDPKFHYPPWCGEGLAKYYAASNWDPKKKKMTLGHLQEGRLVSLKDDIDDGDWLGIEEMIKMESASIKHYTWGWSFAHFLLETPKDAKKFKRFFKDLSGSKRIERKPFHSGMTTIDPEETLKQLRKYLGVKSIKALEKEWHGYIKTKLKVQTSRGFYKAARMAERNGMRLKAKKYYKKAIAAGDASGQCYFDYGKALYRKDDNGEAIKMLEKAIELDPLNAYCYMYLGLAYKDRNSKGDKKKAEEYQRLAMEMDPEDDNLEFLSRVKKKKKAKS